MKKNIMFVCFVIALGLFVGCQDFLQTESYTKKTSGNFPQNEEDVFAMVTAAYAAQCDYDKVQQVHPYFISEMASDDRLGGGGNASTAQGYDKMQLRGETEFDDYWENRYAGIYRTNMIIENIDMIEYSSQALRDNYLGDAHFLRALYYWDLVQIFEAVPLTTSTTPVNRGQASVDSLYAQMGSDFIEAIELLPNAAYDTYDSGRATRWAAEGYLGRVFLFYTGYYNKDSMPLADGTTLTKQMMIEYLEDCILNSGHKLVDSFYNLWTYSNDITVSTWDKGQELGMQWEGEDNSEVMYKYKFSLLVNVNNNLPQRNYFVLNQGIAGTSITGDIYPYGCGWSVGWVVPSMWEDWLAAEPDDIRRWASIINIAEEMPHIDLTRSDQLGSNQEVTGLRPKKLIPSMAKTDAGAVQYSFGVQMWGSTNNQSKANIEDFPLMRFAEIYLMHSELSGDATYMNKVRERVGLPAVSYSLDALKAERRWELAFEGLRWNDIRRWHDAETLLPRQDGVTVYCNYLETKMPSGVYLSRYQETGGFFQIPPSQVALSEGLMKQNKGWEELDNYKYTNWY